MKMSFLGGYRPSHSAATERTLPAARKSPKIGGPRKNPGSRSYNGRNKFILAIIWFFGKKNRAKAL